MDTLMKTKAVARPGPCSRRSIGAGPVSTLMALVIATGCAARSAGPTPPDPLEFPYGTVLFDILATDPGPLQLEAFERLETVHGEFMMDTLSIIAEDPAVHPLLRANAVHLIGQRQDLAYFILLRPALEAGDVRIRLAAVAAAREFLSARPEAAEKLLGLALRDTSAAVQARALEGLAARDAELLRDYLERSPPPQLAAVARDLLGVAEQRGAPLVPIDSTGRLERAGPAGYTLVYRPERRWPRWSLSTGKLILTSADGDSVLLGTIEVARNVMPAFFSPDGAFIVFEAERIIRVHETATGNTGEIGPGIAPRGIPFAESFVFARERDGGRTVSPMGTRIQYEILQAPFAPTTDGVRVQPAVIATMGASANFDVNGAASPLRWAFVTETSPGVFTIVTENADPVALPDPFATAQAR
jgi:hypothetical protein